ncbi:hypothetical protein B842_08615 [Corynebacterium humireducens NBRC 106098 = DSM 45392]|uniref:Secreted protein n=1 Tax=Corynebacterium humireducens NBRC 106098 = DSM 45392 TaxID=1223515 RepID=A0A0B5D997_9CORY|nr:hypothetical protein [Corynebacterium humireducens]AJE33572.1 hypothetical protein B842_08615 [Corynebacterium humireducens NBRC 106098 = DSM 45392]
MIRRRLAVALVAAASTSLALVTPVHAEETEQGISSLSSLSSTTGSSDSTESTPTPTPGEDEDEEKEVQLPGWAGSLEMTPEAELTFEIIRAVFTLGLAATQAAVVLVPLMPGGVDQLRAFLAQFGIQG